MTGAQATAQTRGPARLGGLLGLAILVGVDLTASARAEAPGTAGGTELFLEVFVNSVSTALVGHFWRESNGTFSVEPGELKAVGIVPAPSALRQDGRVELASLPGVTFRYDEAAQTIAFSTAGDAERSRRRIDAGAHEPDPRTRPEPVRFGALMNYSLVASGDNGSLDRRWSLGGVSGHFEPRLFGPYGVLSHDFVASTDDRGLYGTTRLATTWSYSPPEAMRTFRAGDVVTSGLSWTRPVRLGGLQVQNDFSLRPDLVTFPIPRLSGSAAVPSAVDVYLDSTRRYSTDVPAGPFEINNLPIVDGGGTARLVVRDVQGQEVVTEARFFASTRLLATGLADYSAEIGFARQSFGSRSDDYDGRLMGSASLRYGLTDSLTLETHAEGGEALANGGLGAVFGLGAYGIGGVAAAASTSDDGLGYQVSGQVQLELGSLALEARSQRTFGQFDDIASVTARPIDDALPPGLLASARPPRSLDQVTLSVPLIFDPSTISLSFTRYESDWGETSALAGVSYSRGLGRDASFFASGFASLDGKDVGIFAGLSVPLTSRITATASGAHDGGGLGGQVELTRSPGQEVGDYGWRLRGGAKTTTSAAASYNGSAMQVEATLDSFEGAYSATARADGAVATMGDDVYFTRRIDDAFAVVDVGAADVPVSYENRPVGQTGRQGRLLVPGLRSHERNHLSFDPVNLPLDAVINTTRAVVVPAGGSGVVVTFDVKPTAGAALVSFRSPDGRFVPAGTAGETATGARFTVGYDGQAFIADLSRSNRAVLEGEEGQRCRAEFSFEPGEEQQPMIADVPCIPTKDPM